MLLVVENFGMSLKVIGYGTIRQIAYEFLLVFHRSSNCGPILYHF